MRKTFVPLAIVVLLSALGPRRAAAVLPPMPGLSWRMIGPLRGGRTVTAVGVPQERDTYYFGSVGGGVWKSTDGGRQWLPAFDGEPLASIADIAVAGSDPRVVYVGTGESDLRSDLAMGGGVYRSDDAGAHWKFLGLADTRQIGRILVDPRDPNIVLVAALGHAYGASPERGIYRSDDGGKSWRRVLFVNDRTGVVDMCADARDPDLLFAATYSVRRPPWSVYAPIEGRDSAIYSSSDGGRSWAPVPGAGLPKGMGRIGLACARTPSGSRLFALAEAGNDGGLFVSDDRGGTWRRVSADPRITERAWYFGRVTVDPANADVLYVPDVSIYRSVDGGKTFTAFKGAPGGDDYHSLWIDPADPRRMITASDQGAVASVDGGRTWSSWYNQPTAQMYHVVTDSREPYFVYGSQQDSGTAAVASRGDFGRIYVRDWHPVGGEESGYIAIDPRDPNIVYGGGPSGSVRRFDARTGQSQDVSPEQGLRWTAPPGSLRYHFTWTAPLLFDPLDPASLYLGAQRVLRTRDGGLTWVPVSPDLSRRGLPGAPAPGQDEGFGVVYTIAPSPVERGLIWAGTDDGLVWRTDDSGAHWENVSPPALSPWSKVAMIEASRHDPAVAYAAVDRHRLDDDSPYVYRTRDRGRSWTLVVRGLPAGAFVNAVREDPERAGLLYACTEKGVWVSLDDGGNWQSLDLDLPPVSVRDLAVHGSDLAIATHGRGFWILDDVTALRQWRDAMAGAGPQLFAPRPALRVRKNVGHDTPYPPETPAGENPPHGAILDYYLPGAPAGPVEISIFDSSGGLVRRFRSTDPVPSPRESALRFPSYWIVPPRPPGALPGIDRFAWDLRYAGPPSPGGQASGPLAPPGRYSVRLLVGGVARTQALEIRPDPRSAATAADYAAQFALEESLTRERERCAASLPKVPAGSRKEAQHLCQELGALFGAADSADRTPPAAIGELFARDRKRLEELLPR